MFQPQFYSNDQGKHVLEDYQGLEHNVGRSH